MGYSSTLEYVAATAGAVLQETGLLPHINAGVMTPHEMRALRAVSVSQGLMLESLSPALLSPGGAHFNCPDKIPDLRLEMLETAGREQVPFTTGILIGIGETREDRIEALLAIKDSHSRYGHVQEVIIQNFRAKKGTAMAQYPEPPLEELLWTVAVARLILGPYVSIQAPPNLTPESDDSSQQVERISKNVERKSENGKNSEILQQLSDLGWQRLIDAGINDWGGVSPLTRDYVNPERPWPNILSLASATAAAGKNLVPRLPVYPSHIAERWLDSKGGPRSPFAAVLKNADVHGLARASSWYAGAVNDNDGNENQDASINANFDNPSSALGRAALTSEGSREDSLSYQSLDERTTSHEGCSTSGHDDVELDLSSSLENSKLEGRRRAVALPRRQQQRPWKVSIGPDGLLSGASDHTAPSPRIAALLSAVLSDNGYALSAEEIEFLFTARGNDFFAIKEAANELRQRINGDTVTYVVNRNINYTNICTFGCRFCAFSKGPAAEELRGAPYLLPLEEVTRRAAEGWARGATEVCMQGGIHPDFTGNTYLELLAAAKQGAPDIHVHAFSPLEVSQGAATLGWSLTRYLTALKDAGLGSLPGTAAEVLDDAVRAELCPDKLSSSEWLEVIETAHSVGLKTTSTIMFGHVDSVASWSRHLLALRDVAQRTGGISEFVPLPFVHMEAPMYRRGKSRAGPTLRECVLMHAIARLVLHPYITNIQASWVKMGPSRAAELLAAGCNDMGGTLMNESITKAAGAAHGQEVGPVEMEELIRAAGRVPMQRTTMYQAAPEGQTVASMRAGPLLSLK